MPLYQGHGLRVRYCDQLLQFNLGISITNGRDNSHHSPAPCTNDAQVKRTSNAAKRTVDKVRLNLSGMVIIFEMIMEMEMVRWRICEVSEGSRVSLRVYIP